MIIKPASTIIKFSNTLNGNAPKTITLTVALSMLIKLMALDACDVFEIDRVAK